MSFIIIPTAEEASLARQFIDSTKGHSCIHCEYSDCGTVVTRDAAYDVITAFNGQTPIDIINHPNAARFFPSIFSEE